jgi:hypothetical protein
VGFFKIFKMHIPHVSHWSEAVRDIKRIGHGKDSFSNAMTGANHKVISFEIKLFNGCGEKREVISIIFRSHWKPLNERGLDIHPLDNLRDLVLYIDEGIKICIGVKFTEDLKTFLPSSHAGKPIMNQSHLHPFTSFSATLLKISPILP